jgi:hypothetical protein
MVKYMTGNRNRIVIGLFALSLLVTLIVSSCIDDPPTHPEINDYQSYIDLVWELYDQKYIGFDSKNVNWDGILEEYRDLAEEADSLSDVQELIIEMVGRLEDKNCWIKDAGAVIQIYNPEDTEVNVDESVVLDLLGPYGFYWDSTASSMYGHCLIDTIPYLAIRHFNYFFTFMHFRDVVIEYLDAPGIILDIRMSDDVSLVPAEQIPGLFTDQAVTAFLTQHKTGPGIDDLSPLESHNVSPRTWAYTKPIVLLAGEQNLGPAEAFASVMGSFSHVTIIGDTTGGGGHTPGYMSQVFWPLWSDNTTITCPFARVFNADTTAIEGTGIPCDIYVHTAPADFLAGNDPVLEYAIEWIAEETSRE